MTSLDVRLFHDQRVPMRDGISLSADVYLPLSGGPHPTIYQWTPYESTRERFVGWGVWFAQRGYAAVVSDVRGRYESEGEFEAWTKDGVDAQDSLTWAAGEAWCNGRIGTWGRSYGGLIQWQLMHEGHPNLECIAPQVIHDDYFWDGYWTGGAFQLALTLGAAAIWTSAISLVTSPSAADILLNDRVFRHLPLIELDEVTIGRKVDFWREWWEHQENDAYWQQFRHRPESVTVPIFQQGGWFDPYSGSHLRSFAAIGDRVPNRVLMGPWSHEEEVHTFRGDVDLSAALTVIRDHELAFYDRYLRDEGNDWDDRPPLELFVLGRNEWRGESEWPLPGTEPTSFFLRSGGRLDRDVPRSDEAADRYAYDPEDPVPTIGGVNSVLTMTQGAAQPILPGPWDQRELEARRRRALVHERRARRRPRGDRPGRDGAVRRVEREGHRLHRPRLRRLSGRALDLPHGGNHPRALPELARGRQHRAARAGRGRRVPDPLLPDGERLPARPPDPPRRDELELPALQPQPEQRRGRRDEHPDRGRTAVRAPHRRLSVARRPARRGMSAPPFDLSGKTALVTGSTRGIGLALARALAAAGARVAINGRTAQSVDDGRRRDRRLRGRPVRRHRRGGGARTPSRRSAGSTILVNNTGMTIRRPLVDLELDEWRQLLDVNLTSAFLVARAVAPGMIERGSGKIVNVCSVMSELARPSTGAYAATKGALKMLTRTMCAEWAPHGIQANGIAPG